MFVDASPDWINTNIRAQPPDSGDVLIIGGWERAYLPPSKFTDSLFFLSLFCGGSGEFSATLCTMCNKNNTVVSQTKHSHAGRGAAGRAEGSAHHRKSSLVDVLTHSVFSGGYWSLFLRIWAAKFLYRVVSGFDGGSETLPHTRASDDPSGQPACSKARCQCPSPSKEHNYERTSTE